MFLYTHTDRSLSLSLSARNAFIYYYIYFLNIIYIVCFSNILYFSSLERGMCWCCVSPSSPRYCVCLLCEMTPLSLSLGGSRRSRENCELLRCPVTDVRVYLLNNTREERSRRTRRVVHRNGESVWGAMAVGE